MIRDARNIGAAERIFETAPTSRYFGQRVRVVPTMWRIHGTAGGGTIVGVYGFTIVAKVSAKVGHVANERNYNYQNYKDGD